MQYVTSCYIETRKCYGRYGRWNVLFAGLSTLAVATALYGLASTIPWLYIASGLHGASLSLIHVSSLGLLSAFPARTTESMAGIEVSHACSKCCCIVLSYPMLCYASHLCFGVMRCAVFCCSLVRYRLLTGVQLRIGYSAR